MIDCAHRAEFASAACGEFATPTAVVMCGGGHGAYDIVRTLGLAGIRSAVFASHPEDLAFRSRYARRTLLLPEFSEGNFAQIFDRVSAFGATCPDRPVLFYFGDSEIMFISRFREALSKWYRFVLPPQLILQSVMNKARFVDLARQADLPVPPTKVFADAAELESAIGMLELPCIVKPAYNQDWFWETEELWARFGEYKEALRRFDRPTELRKFCAGLPHRRDGFIVQSYIDGGDEQLASFHAYLNEDSRCLGYFLTRAIRTNPPHTGDTTYCETFYDEELARMSQDCLARIGYRGIVKIDYKWDASARVYKMLEIEPHYQTAHVLGAYAGVNLARIAYRHARGEPIEAPVRYDGRVGLLELHQDLLAYWRGYRKTKEWTVFKYVRSLLGRNHYRMYDPRDPRPFLYSGLRYVSRKLRRIAWRLYTRLMPLKVSRNIFSRKPSANGSAQPRRSA
jgi:D-aspartate ligase